MVRIHKDVWTNFRFTSLEDLAGRNASHTKVWCARVSKKVLYETPYIVKGNIVYTGLEKAPKLKNRADNLDGTWEARDMELVAGYEIVFRKIK